MDIILITSNEELMSGSVVETKDSIKFKVQPNKENQLKTAQHRHFRKQEKHINKILSH